MGDKIGDAINAQMLAEGYIYDDDLGIPRELGNDERYLVDPIDVLIQLLHHLGLVGEEQAEALQLITVRLGKNGIQKSLNLGYRKSDTNAPFIKAFIALARSIGQP